MKRFIFVFVLLNSWTAFAHEDTYRAVEKSNVHIKVCVGYETSLNLSMIEAFAEIINNFIKEIDSTEKVFIQFEEDYCFSNYDLVFLAYGEFKKFLIPSGFPFGYKYDMNYINNQKGVNLIIAESYFKLEPLLQLLEFGLSNKDCVLTKGKNFHETEKSFSQNVGIAVIDSILQSESSPLTKKYLSKKIKCPHTLFPLTQKNIELYLQNDSVFVVDVKGYEILKLSTLYAVQYDSPTNCLFLFNSNRTFYFVNQHLKSNQKKYALSFELNCSNRLIISYIKGSSKYKLDKGGNDFIIVDKNGNEIINEWAYFDEKNGVTPAKLTKK